MLTGCNVRLPSTQLLLNHLLHVMLVESILENSLSRAVLFFVVPVVVTVSLSLLFETEIRRGLIYGIGVGLVFAGVSFVLY